MVIHRYTAEEREFLHSYIPGHTFKEIAAAFNQKFENKITDEKVKSYCNNNRIRTGIQSRFQKGHIPFNKGKKGTYAKGSEKGWFKKGHTPVNHREVGSERISKDGYIEIKTAEPKKWELKHRMIYKAKYGEIPENKIIIFADGNKLNCDIDNLRIIDRADNARLNQSGLRSNIPEFTETGILIAKTLTAIGKKKNRRHKNV